MRLVWPRSTLPADSGEARETAGAGDVLTALWKSRLKGQAGCEAGGRADVPTWEYQTWTTGDTKAGRSVREINGESLAEYRPEYPALAEAGQQGWELVGVVVSGVKNAHTLYFKRLL